MRIEILATGPGLIGKGIRGIEPVIEEIIRTAKEEIHVMAYVLTPGAIRILRLLGEAAERGVRVKILVNDLESQDGRVKSELGSMAGRYPHVRVVDFAGRKGEQLHAKVIVADRRIAVVGSANLSWGGMYSNYEVGILIEGEPARQLAAIADFLEHESGHNE